MKLRLMEYVRCPACRSPLKLEDPILQQAEREGSFNLRPCLGLCPFPQIMGTARDRAACGGYEVTTGSLACADCHRRCVIQDGVPQFSPLEREGKGRVMARTASSFGYLWSRSVVAPRSNGYQPYHFDRMEQALLLAPVNGLVLDAGCGEGIDLANQAHRDGVEIYEDFGERVPCWRWLLRLTRALREITTALPPRALYRLCQLGSPLVERRYSRDGAAALLWEAGLCNVKVVWDRGWMVVGMKPPAALLTAREAERAYHVD